MLRFLKTFCVPPNHFKKERVKKKQHTRDTKYLICVIPTTKNVFVLRLHEGIRSRISSKIPLWNIELACYTSTKEAVSDHTTLRTCRHTLTVECLMRKRAQDDSRYFHGTALVFPIQSGDILALSVRRPGPKGIPSELDKRGHCTDF